MTARKDAVVNELKGNVERLITRYIASRDRVRELEREVKAVRERVEALKRIVFEQHVDNPYFKVTLPR